MTGDVRYEFEQREDLNSTQKDRVAQRIEHLYAEDEQFRSARPDPAVRQAAREPGLRLNEGLQTLVDGYADRPALGWRARSLTTDPATGRTTSQLLPRFDTLSYRDLWSDVSAVATAWQHDEAVPVAPGDFVATLGFASPEYLTVDFVCSYLGLVEVPLQHSAAASRLQPIIAEVEPKILATGAAYLDLAVDAALGSSSLQRLVVFDYQPEVDDQREKLELAKKK